MSIASRRRKPWRAGHTGSDPVSRAPDGPRHAHGLDGFRHVVSANEIGASQHGGRGSGERARESPSGIGLARERTDEGLSRDTDAHGPPELADPSETGQHGRVPLVPGDTPMPEESDAGIHHDLLRGDPGLGGEMEAGPKYLRHRLHGWARSRRPGL